MDNKDTLSDLFALFERRVESYKKMDSALKAFGKDLNIQRFQEAVQEVTKSFQEISTKIREIEANSSVKSQIREIQDLEKQHLEIRVQLNDKIIKLHMLQYELSKQKFIQKAIEDCDIEVQTQPKIEEIDKMRQKEAQICQDINECISFLKEDY